MILNKNHILFLSFFSFIFLVLSYLLYVCVSPVMAHCDIDSKAYLENGLLFAKNHSFAARADFPYYTLGYPMIIGLLYNLFGASTQAIIFAQILLALVCGLLIFIIAHRLFNNLVALLSFAFFSVNIGFLVFAQFILTEMFLVFFLLLFFERFSHFLHTKKTLSLAEAGLFLGVSIIVKPAALYYFLLLLPLLYVLVPENCVQKIKAILCFISAFYLPVMGYMTYNYVTFEHFRLGALSEINMLFWFLPNVLAEKHGSTANEERSKLHAIAVQDGNNTKIKEIFCLQLKLSPQIFVYVWLKNVMKTAVGLFTTNLKVLVDPHVHGGDISYFKTKGTLWQKVVQYIAGGTSFGWVHVVGFAEAMWSVMRYVFVLIALLFLALQRRFILLYFFSSYLFYFSMITGHDGCARFRMLFEFILIILAAVGVWVVGRSIALKFLKLKSL